MAFFLKGKLLFLFFGAVFFFQTLDFRRCVFGVVFQQENLRFLFLNGQFNLLDIAACFFDGYRELTPQRFVSFRFVLNPGQFLFGFLPVRLQCLGGLPGFYNFSLNLQSAS